MREEFAAKEKFPEADITGSYDGRRLKLGSTSNAVSKMPLSLSDRPTAKPGSSGSGLDGVLRLHRPSGRVHEWLSDRHVKRNGRTGSCERAQGSQGC